MAGTNTVHISAQSEKSHDDLQPDTLRNGVSHSPSWSTFSATMSGQSITQRALQFIAKELAEAVTNGALKRA
jgi:hypothetical protein